MTTKMNTDQTLDWILAPALAEQVRAVTPRPRQFVQAAVRARLKTHGDSGARATGPAKKTSAKQGKKKTT